MVANINSMAFSGETPWHGEGTSMTEQDWYDWESTCVKAGLDWEAELMPLMVMDETFSQFASNPSVNQPSFTMVENRAVRRADTKEILGVVGPRFTVLQNRDAFKWFQPFLDAKEAQLHTAGALGNGSRVWVLAKLNRDPIVIAPGDEVAKYILLSHGHDGSLAVRCGFTPIRVVCQNTLSAAHSNAASKLVRFKHTKDLHQNLVNIREVMNVANQQFEATAEQYKLLVRKSINQADLKKYVTMVLKAEENVEEQATRTKNMIDNIMGLAEAGIGNSLPSVRGTLWAAYNGVTQWLSYERGNNVSNRLNSLWFGDSLNVNKHALEIAVKMAS